MPGGLPVQIVNCTEPGHEVGVNGTALDAQGMVQL